MFAELVLPPREADPLRPLPRTDPLALVEASDTALLKCPRNPARYDPARRPLQRFFRRAARCDFPDFRQQDGRQHRGRMPLAGVKLDRPAGNQSPEAESFDDHPELLAAVEAIDAADLRVFEPMRDGEREAAVFAAALELTDLPAAEQADVVTSRVGYTTPSARGRRLLPPRSPSV